MTKNRFSNFRAAGVAAVLLFVGDASSLAQEGVSIVSDGGGAGVGGADTLSQEPAGGLGGASFTSTNLPGLEAPQLLPEGFTFNLGTGVIYDDNIYRLQENKKGTTALQASGGLAWSRDQSGIASLSLNYDATGATYLELDDQNSFNQSAGLSAGLSLPRTQFRLLVDYQRRTGAQPGGMDGGLRRTNFNDEREDFLDGSDENPEVDPLTDREHFRLSLSVSRKIAEKTAMNAGLNYQEDLYSEGLQSSKRGSGRLGFDYAVTADTRVGLAGVAGFQNTESSAERIYQEILLTAGHDANERISFSGEAGLNFSQFQGEDAASDDVGFVFSLNYSQRFGAKTLFSLNASRDTGGSAVVRSAAIERTRFTASVGQQVTQRVSLSVSGGLDYSAYESTVTTRTVDRTDKLWRGSISLGYLLNARSSLSLFYSHSRRITDPDTLDYDANQIGVQAGISF